jgi:hypothetical protein
MRYSMFWGVMGGWFCIGLGCVKFGIGCKHFNVSRAIFSGIYGNFCCSVARSGRVIVMNEYISLCILSSGTLISGFFE